MTRLGTIKKREIVKQEIITYGATNTLVVGGPGTGKDFSVVIPNILLENENNIVLVDPLKEIDEKYIQHKREQGYQILELNLNIKAAYSLLNEGIPLILGLENRVLPHRFKKILIHLIFPNDAFSNRSINSNIVCEYLKSIKRILENNNFILFLMEANLYFSIELKDSLIPWKNEGISIMITSQTINNISEKTLKHFDYILFKSTRIPLREWLTRNIQTLKCTIKKVKNENSTSEFFYEDIALPVPEIFQNEISLKEGILYKTSSPLQARLVETYNADKILEL
ncbi:hypothetical protein CN931_23900 [Bacillus sp. AFS054943]|uniref:TraD/TraG TraM recognition site domain-containing protein n=1 Tax=Bacillus cereus TaxID=1396 RepID=A0A2C1LN02_BACCE|nr:MULTISPECIES: type IV secretory system conjugative DNA transfer family protein [Bacillus]PGL78060.1 hypothetical protein CN931_23900 [Bacillus sp. AFS054943]PGT99846.1 hypothetical protein COD19_18100 [Bacillus cereus]